MRSTLWPSSASAAPRLTAVVVLPTPPFCIATAIVRVKSAPSLTEACRFGRFDGADPYNGPRIDVHRPRRSSADPDCPFPRLPARSDPAADGRDLFLRHPA